MYTISDDVRSTHSQDGAIVLAIRTGQVLRLNRTGALVFEQLKEGATESRIVAVVSERFGISREIASVDIREFLTSVEQLGLVYRHVSAIDADEPVMKPLSGKD